MAIAEAIYARLSAFAGLAALVATRIYPVQAPQGVAAPFVTYQQISAVRVNAMGVDTGMTRPRYQVNAWGRSWAEARAVAEQVRLALQRFRGIVSGTTIEEIFYLNSTELPDDEIELRQIAMDFEINHRE